MSKRWGSDYVVTEHRDLQVKKRTIKQQRTRFISQCFLPFVYCSTNIVVIMAFENFRPILWLWTQMALMSYLLGKLLNIY